MQNAKHPAGFGLLGSAPSPGPGIGSRKRSKRNTWLVAALFGLVVAAWVNSQL